jgi:diguanylate cyclase (GGDEF)-like protein
MAFRSALAGVCLACAHEWAARAIIGQAGLVRPAETYMPHLRSPTLFLSRLALKILVILLLCGVLPALVAGWVSLESNKDVLGAQVGDALTTHLVGRRAEIGAWMGVRLRDATRWASAYIVLDAVETMTRATGDANRAREQLNDYLQSVLGNDRVYESLFVVDRRGDVLAATRAERLEESIHRQFVDGTDLEQESARFVVRSEVLNRATLLALHPIRGRRGTTLAFLVERIDLRELAPLLRTSDGPLPLSFWLLDREGNAFVRRGDVAEASKPRPLTLDFSKAETIQEGALDGPARSRYCLTALAPPLEGYLVAAIGLAEARAPLEKSRRHILVVALAGISVMIVAFLWATRGVLRPILFLLEGARRLSAGDLNVYLPVWGRDEIGALTATVNEMIRRLREGREEIEDARDELARANEDLRGANQTLEELAITDGLTGLYNHRHFQDTLEREIRRCDREGRPLSLLMIDIDHFKQFNDQWGHTEGDAALRRVAVQVMKTIRATDSAFRYGGEELAVLLPGCMKEQAREVAEKVRLAVADSRSRRSAPAPWLTVSVGVATSPEDARVSRDLVDAADVALYAAKAGGRNCVIVAGAGRAAVASAT